MHLFADGSILLKFELSSTDFIEIDGSQQVEIVYISISTSKSRIKSIKYNHSTFNFMKRIASRNEYQGFFSK